MIGMPTTAEIVSASDGVELGSAQTADSALLTHWPEYLMEAACLGLFMVSACSFTILLSIQLQSCGK